MTDTDIEFYETFVSQFCDVGHAHSPSCPGWFSAYGKTPERICHCDCHNGQPRDARGAAAYVTKVTVVSDSKPVEAKVAAPVRVAPVKTPTVSVDGLDIGAVRAWAVAKGLPVGVRGRIAIEIKQAYLSAHN